MIATVQISSFSVLEIGSISSETAEFLCWWVCLSATLRDNRAG